MNNKPHLNGNNSYTVQGPVVDEQDGMEGEDPPAQAMGVWKLEKIAETPPVVAPQQCHRQFSRWFPRGG